jgi:hypothetical protein
MASPLTAATASADMGITNLMLALFIYSPYIQSKAVFPLASQRKAGVQPGNRSDTTANIVRVGLVKRYEFGPSTGVVISTRPFVGRSPQKTCNWAYAARHAGNYLGGASLARQRRRPGTLSITTLFKTQYSLSSKRAPPLAAPEPRRTRSAFRAPAGGPHRRSRQRRPAEITTRRPAGLIGPMASGPHRPHGRRAAQNRAHKADNPCSGHRRRGHGVGASPGAQQGPAMPAAAQIYTKVDGLAPQKVLFHQTKLKGFTRLTKSCHAKKNVLFEIVPFPGITLRSSSPR